MEKRLQVFFSGTVQGVGFRYTTEQIARRHAVTGFVRNVPDGTVEVVAEGEEDILRMFMTDIQTSGLQHYIRDTQIRWAEPLKEFKTFGIKF